MKKLQTERLDVSLVHIHNESNRLPGHEERMKDHCRRVQSEYFKNCNCGICVPNEPER